MKHLILTISFVLAYLSMYGSDIKIGYFPEYTGNVSKQDYSHGKSILKNAYAQIPSTDDICYADYWNVAIAYTYMGVNAKTVLALLQKSKNEDQDSFCEIVARVIESKEGKENLRLYRLLKEDFNTLISKCDFNIEPIYTLEYLNGLKENMDLIGLNIDLIDELIIIMEKDQRYRYSSKSYKKHHDKQTRLDEENAIAIASILDRYGYPGKNLVGDIFKDYTCMIVEHAGSSNKMESLKFKENYFPLILEAYHNDQLSFGVLSMLIDRINWFKHGKQVFGSHAGIPFHDEEAIKKIKSKYNL